MRLNRGKSPPYRPWMFEIVLIAIIADPTGSPRGTLVGDRGAWNE